MLLPISWNLAIDTVNQPVTLGQEWSSTMVARIQNNYFSYSRIKL
jgi:hypothetical protein